MGNNEAVLALIRQLEQERGVAIQVRLDTPETLKSESGEVVGDISQRTLTVAPIEGLEELNPQYVEFMAALQGEYPSLQVVQQRVQELNRNYKSPGDVLYIGPGLAARNEFMADPTGVYHDMTSVVTPNNPPRKVGEVSIKHLE